jgi:predicted dehydrogenase
MHEIRVSIIGLDTSHAIEFVRIIQAPECPKDLHVEGLRAVRCLRFETPFQNRGGLEARQRQLEQWGVAVTESFEEAVEDCDALMLEINDPARHLEYFAKCAGFGKPIFLDKPLADTYANGERILATAHQQGTRFFSASSLRFVQQLDEACRDIPQPMTASIFGPLQKAAAGSSIAWYGVHSFEMLQRAMGTGACSLRATKDSCGAVVTVGYHEGRRGVVELTEDAGIFGGSLRTKQAVRSFTVDMSRAYTSLVLRLVAFFRGGTEPVSFGATREIMAMLDAAERSLRNGTEEPIRLN